MNILEKKCGECEIIKDINEFYIRRSSKDGYRNNCKGCFKKYSKKYYEENKENIKEYDRKYYEENKEKKKKYREENKDRIKEYNKKWREENKDRSREWREENKDRKRKYDREYDRNRILNDPLYKLKVRMRTSIYNSLRYGGYTKNNKTNDILGCSYEELLDHLNDNKYGFVYGDDNLDIDHIIPLSKATSEDEIIKLNHYTNLQLLPSPYNRFVKRDNDFNRECLEEWLYKK